MQLRRLFCCLLVVFAATSVFAQQTGALHGRVTASDGSALPGVTVEAKSNVLPQPRVTVTDGNGDYRLPQLQPGSYTLTFTLSGMQAITKRADAILGQDNAADVKMGVSGVSESITVTASNTLVDKQSTEIQSGLTQTEIQRLPVQQNYGDLQKLIPGVMYSQDTFRGPSAGASGQDNVYLFDGINITMPLFGILNAQPNTHDIAQVNVVKGGAKAIDFNRAGGFQIDSVSKSGTNKLSGEIGYQVLNHGFVADQVGTQNLTYAQDRSWATVNIGGPILSDKLFFYGSYYRPEYKRSLQANLYGPLPSYSNKTKEEFLKLTFSPLESVLINGSYRNSHTQETSGQFTSTQAGTTGTGFDTKLQLGTLEGSWIVNPKSFFTAKLTDYRNPGGGAADFVANTQVSTTLGTQLDLANLGTIGRLIVPSLSGTNTAFNAFVQPYITKYGYVCPAGSTNCTPGQLTGGGTVGFGQFAADDDSFFRKAAQFGYNWTFGNAVTHDVHVGYLHDNESEDRFQTSNGWGSITIPGGIGTAGTCPTNTACAGQPAFFVAAFPQQTTGAVPTLHSEFHTQGVEINDTIRMQNWTFNLGVLDNDDSLYGQGLKKADNIAGFVSSPGTKYKMHEYGWNQMVQPRLGATYAYNGVDTIWTSVARYNPAANSDPRAASWDRNLVTTINGYFDANGKLIGVQPNASSSGKLFQDRIKPPEIKEFMVGTAKQLNPHWSGRVYGRYRKGDHFVDDTNNNSRTFAPPPGSPRDLFVPNLGSVPNKDNPAGSGLLGAIGSGSTYVIANLDGAFTKYYEATMEQQWRSGGDKLIVDGSYTWSHYYGNFDQDNTSFNTANDAAVFIGSSNVGDGPGRQLWNFKYGNLRGDRRNVLKMHGTYLLPWHGTLGAFGVFQSGQPYQLESVLPYRPQTGSTSDTARYAEPAGTRRTPAYYDLDLNYTQNIPVHGLNLQLALDVFNVTNNQEGYNYETRIGTLGFTNDKTVKQVPIPDSISDAVLKALLAPTAATFNRADWGVKAPFAKSFYSPRRYQVAVRVQF